jgi:hypothetical protein
MRRFLLLVLLSLFSHQVARAYCSPLPRLICAEYANSRAVVTARLLQIKHVAPPDRQDWFVYTLEINEVLKGQIGQQFRVYEENSSGRASFVWKKGESYLLFLQPRDDQTWWLYGCGNSELLRRSSRTLEVIRSLASRRGALIHGLVRSRNGGSGLANAAVEISGNGSSYKTTTDREGMFRLHVPTGRYSVRVILKGWSIQEDKVLTYEDAGDLTIDDGGCAQVVLFGEPRS